MRHFSKHWHATLSQRFRLRPAAQHFLIFSVYGLPVSFYNDHYDLLRDQEYLFARKISPDATGLKSRLTELYLSPPRDFPVSHDGLYVYNFTTLQGRLGQRHGARFWEQQSTIGQNRELLVVICQRRQVAQRLVSQINRLTDINAFAYLFNDPTVTLPDLGGIEDSLSKRNRHRKALLRLVFDSTHANRMMILFRSRRYRPHQRLLCRKPLYAVVANRL